MNTKIYIYRDKTVGDLPTEILELLRSYLGASEAQQLDTPSQHLALWAWQCEKSLSHDERLALQSAILPFVRQGALALYIQSERAEPIKRLVADLDGCLVAGELLVRLGEELGCIDEMSKQTELAMSGAEDFAENFAKRIALLRGVQAIRLEELALEMPLAPGLELLCHFTEGEAIRLDIASSNLTPYVHTLAQRFGADEYISTMPTLSADEVLEGGLVEPIIGAEEKRAFAAADPYQKVSSEATLSLGDGANDLLMLSATGHALLYCSLASKPLNIAHIVADLYFRSLN